MQRLDVAYFGSPGPESWTRSYCAEESERLMETGGIIDNEQTVFVLFDNRKYRLKRF
jgi:hypothetical protein